ncbi:MAG: response regulator [Gammaproteobacteria bacterium]|nr:response regulator [Gammaproteobacteria bacterium]
MSDQQQTILVVDDTLANLDLLKAILTPFYVVKMATNGETALKIVEKQHPDLILLDVMMPGMDGHEVCRRLKSNPQYVDIPIIFVTAMAETENEQIGFDLGAVDYFVKPIKPALLKARIKTHLALADQRRECEIMVKLRTHELATSQKDAIYMLGEAGHYNDNDTGVHIWRMAQYAGALARAAQWSVSQVELLELAAPMHDTGKIGISDSILKVPRKLTDDEWVVMRSHTNIGYGILNVSKTPLFQMAAEIALHHHEKWDGSGYPGGLSGKEIPQAARIVAIADVFDALTMKRPYKEAWPIDKAFDTLKQDANKHFDPELVNLFISIKDEIVSIKSYWDKNIQLKNICSVI